VLDILADFDTPDSGSVLLQILVRQKKLLDGENQDFVIKNEDDEAIVRFISKQEVSTIVRTRIADRAKLTNSSPELRKWGQEYGRFLRRYRLERQPKHISETCVVVFGTEAVKEEDGRMTENPVALKFMCSRETFLREVKKRPVVDKGKNAKYIVPIRATYSSVGIDEFECSKVNLQNELEPYPNIRLQGSDLKYIIVMDCGAGYDLHDFISHQNVAGKDLFAVTSIAKEIALCLKFLNETCGIIHGDVKARNFVARGVGLVGFAAIDLDNAAFIESETAGQKRTSSGYLPPEQAAVEVFDRSQGATDVGDRPERVTATIQYDMWCFGVLLYFLCTGKQLFNVDTKEDVDDEDLIKIRDWDETWKKDKLSKVDSIWPKRLLDSLLEKDPMKRPENWNAVVDELNRLTNREDNIVYDRIVIFQAAPLVYRDEYNDIQPLPQLDFNQESAMLRGALRDAEQVGCTIDVVLETGSLDRLNAFMAQQMSEVMHFSGHGKQTYMAWEDERGSLKMVFEEELKRQISGIDKFLKCVFVSACHSEWVGHAFVDAGVPHAVCCPVDECLQDIAAIEFTRSFYRGLACRRTLLNAFDLARRAVLDSPYVLNPEVEANKFLLLPHMPNDPSYHDVPIFFSTNNIRTIQEEPAKTIVIGIPRYRELLVGRNVLKVCLNYYVDILRVLLA
jgi:serine/threonine protein kinase